MVATDTARGGFNRICASSTLSTCDRTECPCHQTGCFNRICASSTLSTSSLQWFICLLSGFNRICASSTLSTSAFCLRRWNWMRFQSHLRLFHPIHSRAGAARCCAINVSIASVPLPPYPLFPSLLASSNLACFNRICSSSTLSTFPVSASKLKPCLFQSHLLLFHPIHRAKRFLRQTPQ